MVRAGITVSVDGYVAGPDDGPERGLGVGGEALHSWVFGGPWTYDDPPSGPPTGEDAAWLEQAMASVGAVVAGRRTYECAGRWGGTNPWPVPLFIVTSRVEDEPAEGGFTFVDGVGAAIDRAREAAGEGDVHVMGGASVVRQALAAGAVDELTIITAPLVLGGGRRLFEGFAQRVELEHLGVRQSRYATFVDYRVRRPG